MEKKKIIFISITSFIALYLLIFTGINLFKTEYNDPPYNYLTKNWLNHPIKEIELLDNEISTKINEPDNQNILGFFNSNSLKKDLYSFKGKYFKIKFDTSMKYANFVGKYHLNSDKKKCGIDSQRNDLFYSKEESCPLNLISIVNKNNITLCDESHLNISCKIQPLNDDLVLITSNENIEGEIITQLRINSDDKKICANSDIDKTFDDLIENYPTKQCENEWGYDNIYKKIDSEDLNLFLKDNALLNSVKVIKNGEISLFYRGYLGVDNLSKFNEHPVDHVTYARKIALSKDIILFICCFYLIFYNIYFFFFEGRNKYYCTIKIIFFVHCGVSFFNFLYDAHVIFTYFRVRGIVSTVNLDGINSYKDAIRPFIIYNILILIGITIDFGYKLYKFLIFRRNYNIINNEDNNNDTNNKNLL